MSEEVLQAAGNLAYWQRRAEQAEAERDQAVQRERAAGADMVAIVNAAAAYLAAMTWSPSQDPKWKPGDGIIDYQTPEKRLQKLLKGPERPGAALLAELEATRAVVDAARKWSTRETALLPIDKGDADAAGTVIEALRAYDAVVKAGEGR